MSLFKSFCEAIEAEVETTLKDLEVRKSSIESFFGDSQTVNLPEPGQKPLEGVEVAAPVVPVDAPVATPAPEADEKAEAGEKKEVEEKDEKAEGKNDENMTEAVEYKGLEELLQDVVDAEKEGKKHDILIAHKALLKAITDERWIRRIKGLVPKSDKAKIEPEVESEVESQ